MYPSRDQTFSFLNLLQKLNNQLSRFAEDNTIRCVISKYDHISIVYLSNTNNHEKLSWSPQLLTLASAWPGLRRFSVDFSLQGGHQKPDQKTPDMSEYRFRPGHKFPPLCQNCLKQCPVHNISWSVGKFDKCN